MVIYKITSPTTVADFIAKKLTKNLHDAKKVLWLVPGGSSISIAVQVSKLLSGHSSLTNLMVTLTDERFGPIGHADSNWQQLLTAGFDLPKAKLSPVLTGQDAQPTAEQFANNLEDLFAQADFSLGFFGMGRDGHTAGMLPNSLGASEQNKLAVQYKGSDFRRITLTQLAISRLDTAIVYAVGKEKAAALSRLQGEVAIIDQPAQALKLAKAFYIFSDNKGETL